MKFKECTHHTVMLLKSAPGGPYTNEQIAANLRRRGYEDATAPKVRRRWREIKKRGLPLWQTPTGDELV